jgi:alpha-beta hydrolase superfamily lysophospholipase
MKHRVNGIQLNVRDEGQENPTLLFLHYWGGSSRTWDLVTDKLKTDFRCVAYDHRGWGESDKPETGYSIQELAYDAEALIQALELTRYVSDRSLDGRQSRPTAGGQTARGIGSLDLGRTSASDSHGGA